MISEILQDWTANAGNPKGRFVMAWLRACQWIRRQPAWVIGAPVLLGYVLVVHWLMGVELDYKSEIGADTQLQHGTGLVVHQRVKIGSGCVLRHGVTLGERHRGGAVPVVGDGVEFGAHAIVLGGVRIGNGARIGAGSVVLQDVPSGAAAVGNPAKILPPAA